MYDYRIKILYLLFPDFDQISSAFMLNPKIKALPARAVI